MKTGTTILSVLTVAALVSLPFTYEVAAAQETGSREQVRIVIENNTLSTENGADWTGTLVDEWVSIDGNSTAKDLFLNVLSAHEYTQQGAEFDYITEINGLSAEDGGAMGGWMIQLDDWITDEGLSAYTVSSGKLAGGDTVCFSYSCSWGADLGYDWSGNDTSLSEVVFSAGTVSPDFAADAFDYQLTLPEGTDSVTVQPKVGNRAYRAKVYKNTYTPADSSADYKTWEAIPVSDGDTIIIGIANAGWMQNNYNNAAESVYQFHIGHAPSVDTQVQAVESLIDAIGTVTAQSGHAIETARNAFDALSAEQQEKVSNADALTDAETAYSALIQEKTTLTAEELRERYAGTIRENPVYGNEWDMINLCRFGLATDAMKQHYCESVRQALQETGSAMLSATRSTVNAGVVTALTACGADASDFYGYDLTAPLNDTEYVQKQGLNGAVYALLALDTHDYATQNETLRASLLSVILEAQETDGGWTIDTWTGVEDGSDADMTAMALQALAPYVNDNEAVHTAVDQALTFLSAQQNDKGQCFSYGHYDCESAAQVLTALCALGIDPSQDERFIKNGCTVYDAMMTFFHESDNGFSHFEDSETNYLSTYQAYAAAAAYYRFLNGQISYFNMTDISLTKQQETSQPDEDSHSSSMEESMPVSSEISNVSEVSVPESTSSAVSVPADYVKTGDSAPLYAVGGVLVVSAALLFVSRKRRS